jgi:hypothetical protein
MPTATSLLMDSITSSPIAPPSSNRASTPIRSLSQELSSSPTAPGPVSHRKRPAEDHTQFAKGMSQRFKLRKTDVTELQSFANVSCLPPIYSLVFNMFAQYGLVQQNIVIAAGMFKIQEHLEAMNPPEVLYSIPRKIAVVVVNLFPIFI